MMANEPVPARMLQRVVAWTLDAAAIALPTGLLCSRHIATGIERISRQFDALAETLGRAMIATFDGGESPLAMMRTLLADGVLSAITLQLAASVTLLLLWPMVVFAVLSLFWFAGFEAGAWRATPGKRALGLQVVDLQGQPATRVRTCVRQVTGVLSWLTLNFGHMLAEIPPQRRALHDRIAGMRVVQTATSPRLPTWAKLWLVALCFAKLGVVLWIFQQATEAMDAAFLRLLALPSGGA